MVIAPCFANTSLVLTLITHVLLFSFGLRLYNGQALALLSILSLSYVYILGLEILIFWSSSRY